MRQRIEQIALFAMLAAAAPLLPPQSTMIVGAGLMFTCLAVKFFHHGRLQAVSARSQQP